MRRVLLCDAASNIRNATTDVTLGHSPHFCVQPEAGDYNYSGMHDHGTLPFPREGGEYAQLIGFVCEAKKASDHFLTKVIEKRSVSG